MIDKTRVIVTAGRGGDGSLSLLRAARNPRGGPDGGDGGRGGDVRLVAVEGARDLRQISERRRVEGEKGADGGGNLKSGRAGKVVLIEVPLGTQATWRFEGDQVETYVDLLSLGHEIIVAKGGSGGRGNTWFAGPINQTPVLAEAGELGQETVIELELKLSSDVALIGFPNTGKSALLSGISNARPRIAAYPFTTHEPSRGVIQHGDRTLTAIDLPGLAPDAHKGRGLGNGFLRHAERARGLVIVLDGTSEDLVAEYVELTGELENYGKSLVEKPQVIVVNKIDEAEVQARIDGQWRNLNRIGNATVNPVSALEGIGIPSFLEALFQLLPEEKEVASGGISTDFKEEPIRKVLSKMRVERLGEKFIVRSNQAERVAPMVDFHKWEARMQFHQLLGSLGIIGELERAGVNPGDTVRIGSVELEWR